MTFTATARPPGEYPRNTCPIPPAPRRAHSRYVPTCLGSPAASGSTVLLLRCAGFPEHQQHVAERRGVHLPPHGGDLRAAGRGGVAAAHTAGGGSAGGGRE